MGGGAAGQCGLPIGSVIDSENRALPDEQVHSPQAAEQHIHFRWAFTTVAKVMFRLALCPSSDTSIHCRSNQTQVHAHVQSVCCCESEFR